MEFGSGTGLRGVTIIIVTYNSCEVIESCLKSIQSEALCLVVDNNSKDGTLDAVERTRPDAINVAMPRNLGFGCACNAGLRQVRTPYALLVNPDLDMAPGTLDACLKAAEAHPAIALFGLNKSGLGEANGPSSKDISEVAGITGEFMFMRMSAFSKIGFFDENIFMYFEDNDLCLRTRLAGYGIARVTAAAAVHRKSGSTSPKYNNIYERARIWGQSCAYFGEKYADYPEGQRALRKSSRYRMKSISKGLTMDHDGARLYRSRLRGMTEYRQFGTSVMHDNLFTARDKNPA